jgi:aspartate/methionine/tyrosine aminotransferase
MYAFPSITLPRRAVEEAERRGMPADEMYCLDMVEEAGVVTVPGSGFGQVDGTYHFRTTILPSEKEIDEVIDRLTVFHTRFLERYADSGEQENLADGPMKRQTAGI